ncbi:hypothetical protein FPZ42_08855 [Mucilaginibacter achroorhodeus]|uniref:Uncharacterized protein n=1 Tax=Mucilaginibacter achroorhodeus TaxID=2599294 RepID=A0A563U701_9SPHI|nr:hypothetical protein FPZ42_08855 [Mucilaginibacter achroorhodeus]
MPLPTHKATIVLPPFFRSVFADKDERKVEYKCRDEPNVTEQRLHSVTCGRTGIAAAETL